MAETRDPFAFSPSQVDTYLTCARKWAWRSIARIKTPEGESAKLGTEVHLQLENYLSGKPLDFTRSDEAGYIAAAGLRYLPDPDPTGKTDDEIAELARDIQIENSFEFISPRTGFRWNGRIDLELADSGLLPGLIEQLGVWSENGLTNVPGVHDHKSTASFRYQKSADDLLFDSQAVIYAKKKLLESSSPAVDLSWVYYKTRGGRASDRTALRMYREHADRVFDVVEDVATEMASYHDRARAELDGLEGPPDLRALVRSIPPTPAACSKYGGCPYESFCQLSLAEKVKATMSDETLDSLAARAAAQDASNGATPSVMGMSDRDVPAPTGLPAWLSGGSTSALTNTTTPLAVPASNAPAAGGLPSWLSGGSAPAPATPPPPPPTTATEQRKDAPVNDTPINPPDLGAAPPPVLPPAEPIATETKTAKKGGTRGGKKSKKEDPAQETLQATGAQGELLATFTPVTVNVNVSGEIDPGKVKEALSAIDAELGMGKGVDPSEAFPDEKGFTLYIDCAPVGIAYDPVEIYISRAKARIANEDWPDGKGGTHKVADYRFLPFGQGAGVLTGCVLTEIDKAPPVHLVLSTRTPEGATIASDLAAKANFVVRGAA